jgi:hypothetical protein
MLVHLHPTPQQRAFSPVSPKPDGNRARQERDALFSTFYSRLFAADAEFPCSDWRGAEAALRAAVEAVEAGAHFRCHMLCHEGDAALRSDLVVDVSAYSA